jgi:polyisoprenoid-binding protein YceI
MTRTASLVVCAALLPAAAQAVEYSSVLPDKSEIRFVSKQMNVPVEGKFRKFSAQLAFDPKKPEAGKAQFTVELGAIDTGSDEANEEVKGKGWFDIKNFPTATFVSSSVKTTGPNRYDVAGKLTIKGRSRDITAPVTLRQDGPNAVIEGGFVLKRLQFSIGEGPWSDIDTVADDVQVRFRVTAAPAK